MQIGFCLPLAHSETNSKLASRSFYAKTSSKPRVEILRRTLKFKCKMYESSSKNGSALVGVS